MKRILFVSLVLILASVVYLLVAPVPIDPVAWTPPAAPGLVGPYAQNNLLAPVQRLSLGDGRHPEDVAIDSDGRIYAGFEDGRIIQLHGRRKSAKSFCQHRRPAFGTRI